MSKLITILGATGSIGTNTLKIIDLHPDKFKIFALSANTDWQKMLLLCRKYRPQYVVMADERAAMLLTDVLEADTEVLSGVQALDFISSDSAVDYVMAAIVGSAGLSPTLSAARAGKRILLANKESLVLAGELLMRTASQHQAMIIPGD